ncbi:type I-E CRISPR-associated endoribonuclease Cas2e [Salana multivorans]
MTVVVLTAVPPSLRGVLTRWLFEIAPGVFVGRVSARVRDRLWLRIEQGIGRGRAILVHSARNEQGLAFRVHGHDWTPVDFDGLELMLRPDAAERRAAGASVSTGEARDEESRTPVRADGSVKAPRNWSHAARRLRGR